MTESPFYLWTAEVDEEYSFLSEGGSMASAVGYVPTDGGDFLTFLVRFRQIVEEPRDPAFSEFDDVISRVQRIRSIPAGIGYDLDPDYKLQRRKRKESQGDYHQLLSRGDMDWLPTFVLSEIASYTFDGLSWTQIEALRQQGFGSIREILEAPDKSLLAVKGIGPKRLDRIRANTNMSNRYVVATDDSVLG